MASTVSFSATSSSMAEPHPRFWSRDEYHKMAELGWFEGQRVELVEGEVVQMSPQKNAHYVAIELATEALKAVFGPKNWVRAQGPLRLLPCSEPEPDVAVVAGTRDDYREHPSTALLIVEVSDSSLAYDRQIKSALYARAGIADYWIVNLIDRQLEVFRQPAGDPAEPTSGHYDEHFVLSSQQSIAPLACTSIAIRVSGLLP
jgi:Uma2 family endonuclease